LHVLKVERLFDLLYLRRDALGLVLSTTHNAEPRLPEQSPRHLMPAAVVAVELSQAANLRPLVQAGSWRR
jgi:hypothetical protein